MRSTGVVSRFWFALAVTAAVAVAAATAAAEQLNFTQYTNTEGLPQHQTLALAQDGDGYIWVGTYGGVSRYDGRSFVTLTTHDGLTANGIRDLVVGADGRLWVATLGGGVCTIRDRRLVDCLRAPDRLVADYVTDLELDPGGDLWVATDSGVTRLRPAGPSRHYRASDGLPSEQVWSLHLVEGRLLACTGRGIAELEGDRFRPLPVAGLAQHSVRVVAAVQGGLLVGAEDGLFRTSSGRLERIGVPGLRPPGPFVTDIARSGDTVWVATRSGVVRLDAGGSVRRLTVANGLLTNIVHRVIVDREGIIWFGTDDGLSKLVPGPISVWTVNDGLPHPFVRAIAEDARGRIWLGTRDGIAIRERGRLVVVPGDRLPARRVYSLAPLADGSVLAGTPGGVARLDGSRVVGVWRGADGLPDDFAIATIPERDGRGAWIGTSSGIARWRDGGIVGAPAELAGARPIAMAWGPRGRLWIGLRAGGLIVTDGRRVLRRLGAANGLTDQVIWTLDHDGEAMWVGSNGDGAFRVTEEAVDRIDSSRGLADDFVWQVLCDSRGAVWFYTAAGLDRLADGRIRHFGRGDGLIDLEGVAGAAVEDSEGVLWLGSGQGLVRFDPGLERPLPAPPPVVVESVRSSRHGTLDPGVRLPPTPGVLTFTFTALTFRDERAVRFRHRLLPIEPEWSHLEPERSVRLASLGAGHYRFEVVAENADRRRSPEVAAFELTVLRPWWKRPLALASWAAALVLVLATSVRWRTARLEAERGRLARLVAERTEEVERRADEMRRLAATDELTGLSNRRHMIEVLRAELQRLSRAPAAARLALIVLDLDGFKQVNDILGHNVGDLVLRAVADALARTVRSTDLVARFGGDEFAVILPMTDRDGALALATKVLDAIRTARVEVEEGAPVSVTASIGLAVVAPSAVFDETEVTQLIQRADAALYGAKRAGGNRPFDDVETWA